MNAPCCHSVRSFIMFFGDSGTLTCCQRPHLVTYNLILLPRNLLLLGGRQFHSAYHACDIRHARIFNAHSKGSLFCLVHRQGIWGCECVHNVCEARLGGNCEGKNAGGAHSALVTVVEHQRGGDVDVRFNMSAFCCKADKKSNSNYCSCR